ncbi:hypothetical protein DIPPA_35210 [Diplonema papillatum]|nr:hypothetical protein DIPPA_35210 [Diplonema papillatum]KAJ9461209.1 hypothetical protein DIPPA_35210 [Diplonema papillatum]
MAALPASVGVPAGPSAARRSLARDAAQKRIGALYQQPPRAGEGGETVRLVVPSYYQVDKAVVVNVPAVPAGLARRPTMEVDVQTGAGVEMWIVLPKGGGGWVHADLRLKLAPDAAAAVVFAPHSACSHDRAAPTLRTLLPVVVKHCLPPPTRRSSAAAAANSATTTSLSATLAPRSILHVDYLTLSSPQKATQRHAFDIVLGHRAETKVSGVTLAASGEESSVGKKTASVACIDGYVTHAGEGSKSDVKLSSALRGGCVYECGVRTDVKKEAKEASALQRLRSTVLAAGDGSNVRSWPSVTQRPQLNIEPASVESAEHGATSAALPASRLHFLTSRGVPLRRARTMLVSSEVSSVLSILPTPLISAAHRFIEKRMS